MEEPLENNRSIFDPPGGILIWIIIALELATFGGAFIFYFIERADNLEMFKASQSLLNRNLATLNTLVLIVSGYFAADAVLYLKKLDRKKCIRNFGITALLGLVFVALKGFEYQEKIEIGKTLGTNAFFDFYWLLTGFHLAHVLVGIALLAAVSWQIGHSSNDEETEANVDTVASFWHLCDLIWVLLFPIIYLL